MYQNSQQRRSPGFTIIELLIVLGISGFLITSAALLLHRVQPQTQFSQTAYDFQSKLQGTIREVGTSLFPNVEQFTCAANGAYPQLTKITAPNTTHTQGSNEDCIFLGKAIRVVPGSAKINIYSVLGLRTYSDGGHQVAATTIDQAHPTAALGDNNLTESYSFGEGVLKLVWAKADNDNSAQPQRLLVGFYNNMSNSSSSYTDQAPASVASFSYVYSGDGSDVGIQNCIQKNLCQIRKLNKWQLCYQNPAGTDSALYTLSNNNSGILVDLKFKGC